MANKILSYLKQNWIFASISAVYVIWALAFIYHSSCVATDGRRYFALFDDAMISMRYAWNFAHGGGLVWNVGGPRVEGYTNLLMTLLMSLAAFFFEKRYAVLMIQLTGIFFPLAVAFFTQKIFQTSTASSTPYPPTILYLLVLLYYPLNYWSLMGMETGLLACLLSVGVYASLRYVETLAAKYLWSMVIALGLAHLTRNESVLFAALAFVYLLPTLERDKNSARRFFLAGGVYALFVLGQLAFRYAYYGELVPNTYTLKLVGMTLAQRVQNGWGFILLYLMETAFAILVALIGIWWKPSRLKLYLFSFFLVAILYQVYVGGDAWRYWRMLTPFMPLLFIVFVMAVMEFFERTSLTGQKIALGVFSLIVILSVNSRFSREFALLDVPYQASYARAHVEVAIALNQITDQDATIGVFWAGTLPYYLDRQAIDFLGKSDKYIANLPPDMSGQSAGYGMLSMPGHNKHNLTYSIQKLLPTYVEQFDYGVENLNDWGQQYYVRVKYGETKLYLLKDSPHVKWELIKDYLQWGK